MGISLLCISLHFLLGTYFEGEKNLRSLYSCYIHLNVSMMYHFCRMKTGSIPISAAGHGATNGATNGATRFEAENGSAWVTLMGETGWNRRLITNNPQVDHIRSIKLYMTSMLECRCFQWPFFQSADHWFVVKMPSEVGPKNDMNGLPQLAQL